MRLSFSALLVSIALPCASCSGVPQAPGPQISFGGVGPEAPLSGWIDVRSEMLPPAGDIWLIDGELGPSALSDLASGVASDATAKRRLPTWVQVSPEGAAVWPRVPLRPSSRYTLVAVGRGLIGLFQTTSVEAVWLTRLANGLVAAPGWVAYCADDPWSDEFAPAALDGAPLEWRLGLGEAHLVADRCLEIRVPSAGTWAPPLLDGPWALDPELIAGTQGQPAVAPCGDGGSPCFQEEGGILELTIEHDWAAVQVCVAGAASCQEDLVQRGAVVALRAPPGSELAVSVVGEAHGVRFEARSELTSSPPTARFVLSEALANSLGPEPESEWIEIVNQGNVEGSLDGYRIADGSGESLLGPALVPPGGYALVVRRDFVAGLGGDVIPSPDCVPVWVDEIGDKGLLNSGEELRLVAPDGRVVSELALVETSPGQSSARAPDDRAPGKHAPPGASPGSPNELLP